MVIINFLKSLCIAISTILIGLFRNVVRGSQATEHHFSELSFLSQFRIWQLPRHWLTQSNFQAWQSSFALIALWKVRIFPSHGRSKLHKSFRLANSKFWWPFNDQLGGGLIWSKYNLCNETIKVSRHHVLGLGERCRFDNSRSLQIGFSLGPLLKLTLDNLNELNYLQHSKMLSSVLLCL